MDTKGGRTAKAGNGTLPGPRIFLPSLTTIQLGSG